MVNCIVKVTKMLILFLKHLMLYYAVYSNIGISLTNYSRKGKLLEM